MNLFMINVGYIILAGSALKVKKHGCFHHLLVFEDLKSVADSFDSVASCRLCMFFLETTMI